MAFDYSVRPEMADEDERWAAARILYDCEILNLPVYTYDQKDWAHHIESISDDGLCGILECMHDDASFYADEGAILLSAWEAAQRLADARDERRRARAK